MRLGDILASIFWRTLLGGYFLLLAGIVWFIKSSYLPAIWLDPVFGLYSLCVTVYLLSRFIVGTQLYGFDWPLGTRATPLEWDDMTTLQTSLTAPLQWNAVAQEPFFTYTDAAGTSHTAYFANAQSVQGRLGQARAAGLGVGLWRLGDEDQEIWNLPALTP